MGNADDSRTAPPDEPLRTVIATLRRLANEWREAAYEWEQDGGQSWRVETYLTCADELDAVSDRIGQRLSPVAREVQADDSGADTVSDGERHRE